MLSNTDLHRLIVDLRTHPLAKGGLRQVKEGVYVSLKQSQPKGFDYAFCLSDTDECTFSSGRPIGLLLLQPVPSKARLLASARDPRSRAMWCAAARASIVD